MKVVAVKAAGVAERVMVMAVAERAAVKEVVEAMVAEAMGAEKGAGAMVVAMVEKGL